MFWFIVWLKPHQGSEPNYKVSFQLQQILSGSCCVSLNSEEPWAPSVGKHGLHVNYHKQERGCRSQLRLKNATVCVCLCVGGCFWFFSTLRNGVQRWFRWDIFYYWILRIMFDILDAYSWKHSVLRPAAGFIIWTNLASICHLKKPWVSWAANFYKLLYVLPCAFISRFVLPDENINTL